MSLVKDRLNPFTPALKPPSLFKGKEFEEEWRNEVMAFHGTLKGVLISSLQSLTMSLEKEAKRIDRLHKFRLDFIKQYGLLAIAAKDHSTRIHQRITSCNATYEDGLLQ